MNYDAGDYINGYIPPRLEQYIRDRKAGIAIKKWITDIRAEREPDQFAQPPRFIGAFMLTLNDMQFLYQCGVLVD